MWFAGGAAAHNTSLTLFSVIKETKIKWRKEQGEKTQDCFTQEEE